MCEECAKKVLEILDEMEKAGEFEGLSLEEKGLYRMLLGMRIRKDMKCPKEGV